MEIFKGLKLWGKVESKKEKLKRKKQHLINFNLENYL